MPFEPLWSKLECLPKTQTVLFYMLQYAFAGHYPQTIHIFDSNFSEFSSPSVEYSIGLENATS